MFPTAASALRSFADRLATLAPLAQTDLDALMGLTAQVTRVPANQDIIVPGAEFDYAVLVASGLVGRFLQLSDGRRQTTAIHLAGDLADLHRVATPKAGSALQALTNATIVRVSARELKAIALASPAITHAFWAYAAVDAAILARWAANLRRDAKARMAHLLCEIGARMEYSGQGDRSEFLLELTQSQMGDALGLTPVHVNRTLKALKAVGAVEVDGRIFRIPDWPRLAAIADFDPEYLEIEPPAGVAA